MSHVSSGDVSVMLCDWRGRCTWLSRDDVPLKVGDFMWEHLQTESQAKARDVFARVAALREGQQLEVENQLGERIRVWLWPLDSPDVAVCVLGTRVPNELAMLTARERGCLENCSARGPRRDRLLNNSTSASARCTRTSSERGRSFGYRTRKP